MFDYTEAELNKVIPAYFLSEDPLVLREFPAKQKRKYLVLIHIVKLFDKNKIYSEQDINDILINVYDDYATLRRSLIDYKFMTRTKDGKEYSLV